MAIKEYDVRFEGTRFHCYEGGKGYPILVMHGSGPGAGTASGWSKLLAPLTRRYHVLAFDLIGFGVSGVKSKEPYFDIAMWSRQAQAALDRLSHKGPVGLMGHSLSGYLVLRLAANNPRVDKVLTTGASGVKFKLNKAIDFAWSMPRRASDLARLYTLVSVAPASETAGFAKERFKLVDTPEYRRYFTRMFKGDRQRYMDMMVLTKAELKRLKCQVTIVHGAQDQPVPFRQTAVKLAEAIPQADLIRLANCGHTPAVDQPDKMLDIARSFFG